MTTGATDIHTHIVPATFPAYAGRHSNARWPSMAPAHDCHHCNVMIAGKVFRTVSDHSWSLERRLEVMEASRVERQVLSPMPELLSYWMEPEDAESIGRHVNDTIATMVADGKGRFAGLGMVPMQDPDRAVAELERLMKAGFKGVEIGTNVNGVSIGDKRYASFFETAERLGAAIFVHALHPAGTERLIGPPNMPALALFPCETSTAIVSLMMGGIIGRHPEAAHRLQPWRRRVRPGAAALPAWLEHDARAEGGDRRLAGRDGAAALSTTRSSTTPTRSSS